MEAASLEKGDHQAVFFAEIRRIVLNERPYKSIHHELVKVFVCILTLFINFRLSIINTTLLY